MRSILIPATIVASLALAPIAFAAAAQNSTGVIKSYDAKTHTLMLADGTDFVLKHSIKTANLKPGAKVEVSYTVKDKINDASTVKIVK